MLEKIIDSRFDVKPENVRNLTELHLKLFGESESFQKACEFFRDRVRLLYGMIKNGEPVFATNLFHAVLGSLLCGTERQDKDLKETLVDYVYALRGPAGGFLAILPDYVKAFPKFGV